MPLLLLTALLLGACAARDSRDLTQLPAAPSGDVVVRDYIDPQKRDGVDTYFRIRYMWDYIENVAVMERSSLEGEVVERTAMPGLTLETTADELAYAIALVRNDPQLQDRLKRPDLNFHGGFSVRGPEVEGCNLRSRCIRIFVSTGLNNETAVAHAIVDLAGRRIVDRDGGG
jgi:hypothetical protein